MMQAAQKPFEIHKRRDFGAIIGDTFVYTRSNFKPLLKSIVIIAGPFMLLAAIYTGISQVNIMDFSPGEGYFSTVAYNSLIGNLFMMLSMVLLISVVHAYVKLDMEKSSEAEIGTDAIWQLVKQNVWKSLGIMFLFIVFFLLLIGLFALIFYAGGPVLFGFSIFISFFFMMYLIFRLSFVYAAGLVDDYSTFDSFTRSWNIADGYFWNNLGIIFIFGILVGMISSFAAIPAMIFTFVGAMHGTSADINPIWKFIVIAIQTVGTFIAIIGYTLPLVAYVLQYYSAVEKTEGVGLLNRIEGMNLKTEDNQHWGEETY